MEILMDECQKTFNEAREFIRYEYGLELSLIELVILNEKYVRPNVNKIKKYSDKDSLDDVDAGIESATTFLYDYYGVPAYDIKFVHSEFNRKFHQQIKEYLKIIQERSHLL